MNSTVNKQDLSIDAVTRNASFWGAIIGTPLATLLAAIAIVFESKNGSTPSSDIVVGFACLAVSIRYFFRAQFLNRDPRRVQCLDKLADAGKRILGASHFVLVAGCCLNVAVLRILGAQWAALLFSFQALFLLPYWFTGFNPIFVEAGIDWKNQTDRQFAARHIVTLASDLIALMTSVAFLVVFFLGSANSENLVSILGGLIFGFLLIETAAHLTGDSELGFHT